MTLERYGMSPSGEWVLEHTDPLPDGVLVHGPFRISDAGQAVRVWTDEFQIVLYPDGRILIERGLVRVSVPHYAQGSAGFVSGSAG